MGIVKDLKCEGNGRGRREWTNSRSFLGLFGPQWALISLDFWTQAAVLFYHFLPCSVAAYNSTSSLNYPQIKVLSYAPNKPNTQNQFIVLMDDDGVHGSAFDRTTVNRIAERLQGRSGRRDNLTAKHPNLNKQRVWGCLQQLKQWATRTWSWRKTGCKMLRMHWRHGLQGYGWWKCQQSCLVSQQTRTIHIPGLSLS